MSSQPGVRAVPSESSQARAVHIPRWLSSQVPEHNSPRTDIFRRDGYRCVYCGTAATTMDHLIPHSLFQALLLSPAVANQDANRVACCWECNQLKRDWLLG